MSSNHIGIVLAALLLVLTNVASQDAQLGLHDQCRYSHECGDNQWCEPRRRECQCKVGTRVWHGQCVIPLRYGSACSEDIECIMSGLVCSDHVCQCGDTQSWDGNKCQEDNDAAEQRPGPPPGHDAVVSDDLAHLASDQTSVTDVGVAMGQVFGPLGFVIVVLVFIGVFIVLHNNK